MSLRAGHAPGRSSLSRQSHLNVTVLAGLFTEKLLCPAVGLSLKPRGGSCCLWGAWNQSCCIPAAAHIRQPEPPSSGQLPGMTPGREGSSFPALTLLCPQLCGPHAFFPGTGELPGACPWHWSCLGVVERCWAPLVMGKHPCWSVKE